jgi:hypothetical protein
MNDFQEGQEAKEVTPIQSNNKEIGPTGMESIRGVSGNTGSDSIAETPEHPEPLMPPPENSPAPEQPADNQDDPITIHPKKGPEYLPDVEKEPISNEGKIQPPPGWQPGGPERGG